MNFEHPYWLLGVPAVLALALWLFYLSGRARARLARTFAADRLVGELLASHSPRRRKFKHGLILVSLALLVIALARPQWGFTWRETKSKGIDIMFVVDVSRSMLAQDIKPNRLARSKLAILDFIDRLEGDRVGLVAFAGNAFLQCPLTLDYNAFRQSLEAIDTNVISLGGTDISRAIGEAEAAFSSDTNHKLLVLITDGEDLEEDGVTRAAQAAKNGVTIYTVGVGTPEGELIPVRDRFGKVDYLRDDDGKLVQTKLDEDTLHQIAEVTDGFYVPLGPTGYGLEQVYEAGLASIPKHELSAQLQRTWLERFQWPLGIAIVLLAWEPLLGTRRIALRRKVNVPLVKTVGKASVTLFLFGLMLAGTGNLRAASVREGEQLFRQGDYQGAADQFRAVAEANPSNARASYNLGNALQALGQTEAAQAAYARSLITRDFELQADAFYNLGAIRFQQGETTLGEVGLPELDQQNQQAMQGSGMAMRQGEAVLRAAETKEPEQQQVQQALQLAEQAKTASESARAASQKAKQAAQPARELWKQSVKDFKSSLELNPAGEDAAHNANYAQEQLDSLDKNLKGLDRAVRRHDENIPALEDLIEKLKELLKDQQNQQDQNQQQNQDQQDQNQQQNQQDQQQGSSGQSGQQDQPQSQDQQPQNQDQPNQSGDQQQNQSPDQSGEDQKQDQPDEQNSSEQSGQEPASPSESEQSGESGDDQAGQEPREYSPEEIQQMIDALEQANRQNEEDAVAQEQPAPGEQDQTGQAAESGEEQTAQEQAAEAEAMTVAEEEAAKAEQAAARAAVAAEEAAEDAEKSEEAVMGVMSREDARRLLESLGRDEKKLPVSGYGRRESRVDEQGKRKDW